MSFKFTLLFFLLFFYFLARTWKFWKTKMKNVTSLHVGKLQSILKLFRFKLKKITWNTTHQVFMDYSNFYVRQFHFYQNSNCSTLMSRTTESTIVSQGPNTLNFASAFEDIWCKICHHGVWCHIFFKKLYSSTKFTHCLASYIVKVSFYLYNFFLFSNK